MLRTRFSVGILALTLSIFAVGCKTKPTVSTPTPVTTPAPPPEAKPAPSIRSFSVEPTSITAGQSATLRWAVENADSVSISAGVGTVQASGNRSVSPSSTTTYRLSASGPGGTTERSVTLNVSSAPPADRPAPPASSSRSLTEMVGSLLSDIYFDYDKSDVREDGRGQLTKNAEALRQIFAAHPDGIVTIEGHCDERGSAEYNLGLGDRRSSSVKDYLVNLGVPGDKLKVISYGNEKPACSEANESCYQKNRRAHFSAN
ncbi:OmpA family protein [Bryobacter aggregatus]|uniref:OmpA family protein n=1 Tax=Bryobacter aggregatus TaxID=360054 RepID=UPI0004E220E4|nr:OmpA family protein [Bryobacter aggregatus]